MLELTTAAAIIVGLHVTVIYVASEVLHLDALPFAMVIIGTAIVSAIVAKATQPTWLAKFKQILNQEKQVGDVKEDLLGVLGVFVAGAVANNWLMVRRFGAQRWAGVVAVNMLVNWLLG